MALAKSSLLIRDYDNIRDILRNMYIFGCFTRDDYIEMGYGGRKYDNEQRRIKAYLPEKFISKRRIGKKVIQYCKYNVEDGSENYLEETYRNKSFTMLDIMVFRMEFHQLVIYHQLFHWQKEYLQLLSYLQL